MMKTVTPVMGVRVQNTISDDSVFVQSGSFVIDNSWITFKGTNFKVSDYIKKQLDAGRAKFFNKIGYALKILIGIDGKGELQVVEGSQVLYSSKNMVPLPLSFSILPLLSVTLIQDGSTDLNYGFKPINDNSIDVFSGYGNILDKDQKGITGSDCNVMGITGVQGDTGIRGEGGITGLNGLMGITGPMGSVLQGGQGLKGMTGICWDIDTTGIVYFNNRLIPR